VISIIFLNINRKDVFSQLIFDVVLMINVANRRSRCITLYKKVLAFLYKIEGKISL
jgi:hypothetical protein